MVRAPPDGYTLLFTVDLPITMAPALLKLHYDPQHDLIPIAAVVEAENVLTVNASAGNASPAHLCGEMIKRQTGVDMIHVPYTGAAPAMNGVLAGNVTMFCGPIQVALPHLKAGSIIALGVTGLKPSPLLPGVAPLSASYPGLVISNWYGLLAPARTPASVSNMLQDKFKKISADPELQRKLLSLGLESAWISGNELSQTIASDIVKWRDFMTAANIHAE